MHSSSMGPGDFITYVIAKWKPYLSLDFLLGVKEYHLKVDGCLHTLGNYTKTSSKTGHENMLNQKFTRDCGRARNAQGSPKAGARAIFVQKNLAPPPFAELHVQSIGANLITVCWIGHNRLLNHFLPKRSLNQLFDQLLKQDDSQLNQHGSC